MKIKDKLYNCSMEKFEDWKSETQIETKRIESHISQILPTRELIDILGVEAYLIGGAVRDIVLEKQKSDSDLDLMTRLSVENVSDRLNEKGFTRITNTKFREKCYSMKEGTGVINLYIDGKEV